MIQRILTFGNLKPANILPWLTDESTNHFITRTATCYCVTWWYECRHVDRMKTIRNSVADTRTRIYVFIMLPTCLTRQGGLSQPDLACQSSAFHITWILGFLTWLSKINLHPTPQHTRCHLHLPHSCLDSPRFQRGNSYIASLEIYTELSF